MGGRLCERRHSRQVESHDWLNSAMGRILRNGCCERQSSGCASRSGNGGEVTRGGQSGNVGGGTEDR